jgi:hypothetical protein
MAENLDVKEEQTQQLAEEGSIWKAVLNADGAAIMQILKRNPSVLRQRDPVGATPLLLLALFKSKKHIELAKRVIHFDKKGDRLCDKYTSGPYEGENILHIAIVNENLDFARWLLQKNKSLLVDQTVGSFFTSGGPCPWGGFPLSFAAATNQPEMIDLLLENGADLFAEDADGMTALNIAVRSDMPDMYNKLADLADSTYTKCGIEEDQMKTLRRSCLQTSVLSNKPGMFELLLDRSKITMWTYGPVASCLYPLSHLDCSMGSGDDDDGGEEEETSSILNMVIQNERFDILRSSVVSKLVDLKWEKFGRAAFFTRLKLYIGFLAVFTAGIIIPKMSLPEYNHGDIGGFLVALLEQDLLWWTRAACETVILAAAFGKLKVEVSELREVGIMHHFWLCRGAQALENWSSALACGGILFAGASRCAGLYFINLESLEEISLTISVLSMWIYLLWFFLGWRFTGPFVIMIVSLSHVVCSG